MKRHDEELARLRKQRKYGNRPKSAREDLLASIMATESKEFYGNGIGMLTYYISKHRAITN
jgi:hypothetical protein